MIVRSPAPKDPAIELLTRCNVKPSESPRGRQQQVDRLANLSIRTSAWFARSNWRALSSVKLDWLWHHQLIMDKLDELLEPGAHELVINIPPGEMKSYLVSVLWPAKTWLLSPGRSMLCFANEQGLPIRDGLRMRSIIESDWYQQLVWLTEKAYGVPKWDLSGAQNTKMLFKNSARGFRQNLGLTAKVTGKRADIHILDDPHDAKDSIRGSQQQINRRMAEVTDIYRTVLSTRVDDPRNHARVLIMQRIHQLDLSGYLLRAGAECIVLPTEYEPELTERLPGGVYRPLTCAADPRTERGELLNPIWRNAARVAHEKESMGARAYAAQHDQRPTPAEGTIFRRGWFDRSYIGTPHQRRYGVDKVVQSIDCNFKKTEDGSHAVIQTWGSTGFGASTLFTLLWQVKGRWSWLELEATARRQLTVWNADEVWIEDKANGPALIESLRAVGVRLDGKPALVSPFDPGTRDKVERAQLGSAPAFEAGYVELPMAQDAPWIDEYVENHLAFPDGSEDDEIDATSQFLIRARGVLYRDPLEEVQSMFGWMDWVQ